MQLKTLLRSETTVDLYQKVMQSIGNGNDILTNVFADEASGLLCQWMAPRYSRYEYRLIEAANLEDFEAQVHGMTVMSFDFMFNTVLWNGKILQWMYRVFQETPEISVKVIASPAHTLLDNGTVDPAQRARELQLVEGVRVALRMAPVDFVFSSCVSFPLV